MPNWLIALLLAIFLIHFVIFARQYYRRKENYYLAASFTFLLLVLTFSIRLWWPDLNIAGYSAFWMFRIGAWISAAVSISWLLYRRFGQP